MKQLSPAKASLARVDTLVDLLRHRTQEQPEWRTYTFLEDGERRESPLTIAELERWARAIAARLQDMNAAGERALLLYPPGLPYVEAFFGCLFAGVIAVPAYPPNPAALDRTLPRLQAIIEDARATIVLTTSQLLGAARTLLAQLPGLDSLRWLATDSLPGAGADDADAWRPPGVGRDDIAFLQYTSGSTSAPRGVMLSHGNLLDNSIGICDRFDVWSARQGLVWLPPYHDMGLIGGVLQPLCGRFPMILMSPLHFLQRPMRWLEAISRYRVTLSGGPNFAYGLCARKSTPAGRAKLDLSRWDLAFNGAEPIRADILEHFIATFGPCGFRSKTFFPCYGLAEATLLVTADDKLADLTIRTFDERGLTEGRAEPVAEPMGGGAALVSCGYGLDGHDVAIVQPDSRRRCQPGQIGEIWVAGASVAQGYWGQEEASERTFGAHLADTGEGPYLRTGDLGFLADGQLYVTGRSKDLIIVNGRNYYPQDIERTVESCSAALKPGCGAAFAVSAREGGLAGDRSDTQAGELLIVVQELDPRKLADGASPESLLDGIRTAIIDAHQLQPHAIILIKARTISKTSSGKIQRYACRQRFLAGQLDEVARWIRPAPPPVANGKPPVGKPSTGKRPARIRQWLLKRVARELGVAASDLDPRQPLAHYGLGSVQVVSLTGDLETWLEQRLPPTLIYEYPTIDALADHLGALSAAADAAGEDLGEDLGDDLGEGQRSADAPVAIIGIGCRFPGASDKGAFWRMLCAGTDAISEVSNERERLCGASFGRPGARTRQAGFLQVSSDGAGDPVTGFDAHFFAISAREAADMDPQQRLLLEVAWEALEDAGRDPVSLRGSETGVFVGISSNDYGRTRAAAHDRHAIYRSTGNALSIAANRLSYLMDLRGPSMAVDTACSSSLVAVHLASRSLHGGEADLALVGGVNLLLSPAVSQHLDHAGFLADDGRCKSFDARADGYVRGEGVGVVVLAPLDQAVARGDRIYAVIRGSATNNDGRSNGLTAPNRHAQEAVLRAAYRRARVAPSEVQYIEAHGTGTALGDPIEVSALAAVVGPGRAEGEVCAIGSVKSNIGHLESAAGIAGLIKTTLALHHGQIPPSLHYRQANPRIPFAELPIRVQDQLAPWPTGRGPALAGVSSFGFGGANAHVVLAGAPPVTPMTDAQAQPADTATGHDTGPYLLPISAHRAPALDELAREYCQLLDGDGHSLADIARCAATRRAHLDHKLAIVARDRQDALAGLRVFLRGDTSADVARGHARAGQRAPLAFVFSGQGTQWWSMGRGLLREQPVFRQAIEECDALQGKYTDWSLLAELRADREQSRLQQTRVVQPALFAIQVGLARLWRHWGVQPDALIGHSVGEIAAAHVAGALSLDQAVRIIVERGRLMQAAHGRGRMAEVHLAADEVRDILAGMAGPGQSEEDGPVLAAENSARACVVAGQPDALDRLADMLAGRDVFFRRLPVPYAFHSPDMDAAQAPLREALRDIRPRECQLPLFSTMTGAEIAGHELDADYWARQLRQPVRFAPAISAARESGCRDFLEIGAHPALRHYIRESLPSAEEPGLVLGSLVRDQDEMRALLRSAAALCTHGQSLKWARLTRAAEPAPFVALPGIPWQRESFWTQPDQEQGYASAHTGAHPLLGQAVALAHRPDEYIWRTVLDTRRFGYLAEHRFDGVPVMPASGYLELAMAAGQNLHGPGRCRIRDVRVTRPLFLPAEQARQVQVVAEPAVAGARRFSIHSRPAAGGGPFVEHAYGLLVDSSGAEAGTTSPDLPGIRSRCPHTLSADSFYQRAEQRLLEYGPGFRGVAQVARGPAEVLAEIRAPATVANEAASYCFHPAVLDAACQIVSELDGDGSDPRAFLPVGVRTAELYKAPEGDLFSHAQLSAAGEQPGADMEVAIDIWEQTGAPVLRLRGLALRFLEQRPQGQKGELDRALTATVATADVEDWLYRVVWRQLPNRRSLPQLGDTRTWLLFADRGGVARGLASILSRRGDRCVLVRPGAGFRHIGVGESGVDEFEVDAGRADDYRALFSELAGADRAPLDGAVHMWSLDVDGGSAVANPNAADRELTREVADLERANQRNTTAVLHILRELVGRRSRGSTKLWLVTRACQVLDGDVSAPRPWSATLWGLGRTVAQEHPELFGGLLDLPTHGVHDDVHNADDNLDDDRDRKRDARQIADEIRSPDGENQIALRSGRRFAARLVRAPSSDASTPGRSAPGSFHCRPDSSYLITGGLGGLGLQVADAVIERGARRLVLIGRTRLPERTGWAEVDATSRLGKQIAAIRALEARGVSVHVASVDIGDPAALAGFVRDFRRAGYPPLRGVIHLAGVLQDQILLRLDQRMLDAVFRAKAVGAWLLHRTLGDHDLDFFVMFSSIAAVLGSAGQGNYAAANAFLDALAHHRRALGLPAQSIDWGPWSDVGVATSNRREERLSVRGIGSIEPAHGLALMARLLVRDDPQVTAVVADWQRVANAHPILQGAPIVAELMAAERQRATRQARITRGAALARILSQEPERRMATLAQLLVEHIGRAVGRPAAELDQSVPLTMMGIDSLMGIELRSVLEAELDVPVPMGMLLDGPTIEELARALLARVVERADSDSSGSAASPDAQTATETDTGSDADGDVTRSGENGQNDARLRELVQVNVVRSAGVHPTFFCIHPGALEADCYQGLAAHLSADQPFHLVRVNELEAQYSDSGSDGDGSGAGNGHSRTPMADLARQCVHALRAVQPHGPYFIGGWSLGGVLAFEVARTLRADRQDVALLALFDTPTPSSATGSASYDDAMLLSAFASYLQVRGIRAGTDAPAPLLLAPHAPLDEQFEHLSHWARQADLLPEHTDSHKLRSLFRIFKAGLQRSIDRLSEYRPGLYSDEIVYFRANEVLRSSAALFPDSAGAWDRCSTQPMAVFDVPGDHYTMFQEPNVASLAANLDQCLRRAHENAHRSMA